MDDIFYIFNVLEKISTEEAAEQGRSQ
jgi:hypothetical protein